jgi:small-conductance mechanosensitive channel
MHVLVVIVLTVKAVQVLHESVAFALARWVKRTAADDLTTGMVVSNVAKMIQAALWLGGAIFVLDNLGINVTSVLAGLGIGGIAVALAAQAMLGDVFSSLAIFLDKPFKVGDFIIVGDLLGAVEHIGFKTTRIRSLHGEQLIFSNSDLTSSRVRNYKRMDTRRVAFQLGVTYQTTTEQVKAIPVIARDIVLEQKLAKFDRAHFQKYGDFALIFEIVYYVLSPDYNTYMDVQQAINVRIKEEFERANIEFAYPTQQLYVTQVSSLQAQ